VRALALLSGGLDSTLAIRLMQEQGVEVEAVNFVSGFCTCTPKESSCSAARTAVRQLGVELTTVNTSEQFLEVVRNPRHGYGSGMNPCLDCRIMMLRRARERMPAVGARFLVTGEVLNERPMSQRLQAMRLIEREAGVEGLVLRPLCARRLEPSIPERKGWVERERLLGLHGRQRTPQIELARRYGIRDYPCPAGGCRLTEPGFAARMKDLLEHRPGCGLADVQLLKVARHFRLGPRVKAAVGRDEAENERLKVLRRSDDRALELADVPGPLTLLRGEADAQQVRLAAAIAARYSRARDRARVRVSVNSGGGCSAAQIEVAPARDGQIAPLRVGR